MLPLLLDPLPVAPVVIKLGPYRELIKTKDIVNSVDRLIIDRRLYVRRKYKGRIDKRLKD